MTCIIGMAHEGKVYIGADSAGANEWLSRPVQNPKLLRVGEFLIGYTDSFRLGQILQYNLTLPVRAEEQSDEAYIVCSFIPAFRDAVKGMGFSEVNNNVERGVFPAGLSRPHLRGATRFQRDFPSGRN